ncbi:DUF993 family protein, partial [Actinoplanes sp. NPDC048791]|uniref:DUF993 family protein n=1 Tax=Actinoplanes sp. NPDC048791 TaxID=3154623 RepID=UPI0033EC3A17
MSRILQLPDGPLTLSGAGAEWATPGAPFTSRVAYAAAHVVADPAAENVPGAPRPSATGCATATATWASSTT